MSALRSLGYLAWPDNFWHLDEQEVDVDVAKADLD
jgi:hypothetical protein